MTEVVAAGQDRASGLYDVLGVASTSTSEQLHRAYRSLSKRWHPDAPTGDAAKFIEVARAYRILSNPEMREHYDTHGSIDERLFGEAEDIFRQALVEGFAEVVRGAGDRIDEIDIIGTLRQSVQRNIDQVEQQLVAGRVQVDKLAKLRDRIDRGDGATNLFAAVLNKQITEIETALVGLSHRQQVLILCREELSHYTSLVEMTRKVWFQGNVYGHFYTSSSST